MMRQKQTQKQLTLQLMQLQSTLTSLKQSQSSLSSALTDTKDALRKHRENTLNLPTLPLVYQNQQPAVYCINSANFYHQINMNKIVPYLQTRIAVLTKQKKKMQQEINKILNTIMQWVKSKKIGGGELGAQVREWVREYMEDMEDMME